MSRERYYPGQVLRFSGNRGIGYHEAVVNSVSDNFIHYTYSNGRTGEANIEGKYARNAVDITPGADRPFYMLYVPSSLRLPQRKHSSLQEAEKEANRLINECGVQEVIVLSSTVKITKARVIRKEYVW